MPFQAAIYPSVLDVFQREIGFRKRPIFNKVISGFKKKSKRFFLLKSVRDLHKSPLAAILDLSHIWNMREVLVS
jgi:hypothetical protein